MKNKDIEFSKEETIQERLTDDEEDITNCTQWEEEEKEAQKKPKKTKKSDFTPFKIKEMQNAVDQLKEEFSGKWDHLKRNEKWEMGIDEAGRGPAVGPMVYSALVWPSRLAKRFEIFGFKDSKKTTEEERRVLYSMITQLRGVVLDFKTGIIPAQVISSSMLAPRKISLNVLAQNTTKRLIRYFIDSEINLTTVKVDALGNTKTYQNILERAFSTPERPITFIVEEKADSKHPVVSATSICAKFERDDAVENWVFEEPGFKGTTRDYGCGYPSDPQLKEWIRKNCHPVFSFPNFVRHSWGTSKTIVEQRVKEHKSASVVFPADLLEEKPEGAQEISKVFRKIDKKTKKQGFFCEDLGLTQNIDEMFK